MTVFFANVEVGRPRATPLPVLLLYCLGCFVITAFILFREYIVFVASLSFDARCLVGFDVYLKTLCV